MANVQTLIDRNHEFVSNFQHGDLRIRPRLSTLILTCLDARVDPAHVLGLELGDAFVMRNIGGRVTDEIVEHIAILLGLAAVVAGGPAFELAIVQHTDCGAKRFSDPQVRQRLGQVAGTGEAAIEKLTITDPRVSVTEDLDRLRAAPILPDDLAVAGYVYDVIDGHVREVQAPASLRDGARS